MYCCRSGYCSYTCTPDGVQELVTTTGTMDRWAEAVIENSYGRVSLLPQPLVLPTLYMPSTVAPGLNSFTYSESLVQSHLRSLGYDLYRDFHTLVVSSPLAHPLCSTLVTSTHSITSLSAGVAAAQ